MNPFRRRKHSLPSGLALAVVMLQLVVPLVSQTSDEPSLSLSECWRNTSIQFGSYRPAFDRNNIYVAGIGGRLSAISVQTGKLIWSTELGGDFRSNVAVLGTSVFVIAGPEDNGKPKGPAALRGVSANTGVPSLDIPIATDEARLFPIAGRIVILEPSGHITTYEQGGRALAWQRTLPQIDIGSALAWSDKIVFATVDLKIHIVASSTGADLSVVSAQHRVTALGVIDDDIIWGDDRGEIVRYDLTKGDVYWRFKNGARIAGFASNDEGVAAASLDNFTYFISSYYGSVRWKKRLPGRVQSITPFGKDLIVVQTVGDPTASVISLEDGKSAAQVSIGEDSFVEPPLDVEGRLIFFTNDMVFAESSTPCSSK